MDRCLLDASTPSDLIQPRSRRSPTVARNLTQYLREWERVTFSHISCYEILRGLRKKQAHVWARAFLVLCERSELLAVTYAVLDRAADLWAKGQRAGIQVDDVDLVIAATAIVENLSVVSANRRHFTWITGLNVSNWREP